MRARITRELILRRGFTHVAVEADWPDAGWIDRLRASCRPRHRRPVRRSPASRPGCGATGRCTSSSSGCGSTMPVSPSRRHGPGSTASTSTACYGSIAAVLGYLDEVDPGAARIAAVALRLPDPLGSDPAAYGHAARDRALPELRRGGRRHAAGPARSPARLCPARRRALLRGDPERPAGGQRRAVLPGDVLRRGGVLEPAGPAHVRHAARCCSSVGGPAAKAVVWEHNSHIGDAAATEMGTRGEHNVGRLCRQALRRARPASSASGPITGPSRRRATGTGRWR